MKKLKVGIIGAGLIAKEKHIPTYKKMSKKNIELIAICDLNENLAKELAHEFDIPKIYDNVSDMLYQENLDIVDICVPPQIHSQIALEAMDNGCNIIMEKPMALTTSECDEMINSSKKNNVEICVIHNNLFHHPFLKAKKMVKEGKIGKFIGMRILQSTPRNEMLDIENHWYHSLPGGMIGETGPHTAYITNEFLKNIINVDIYAKNLSNRSWAPFDEFRIEIEGENGFCSAILSYSSNCRSAIIDIFGTEAFISIDLARMSVNLYKLNELDYRSIGKSSLSTVSQITKNSASNALNVIMGKRKIGTELIIEKFVDSIIEGTSAPVTGEDGKAATQLMEMIVKKYEEKYSVKK